MEIPPHFIHGFASGIARRTKDPSTLRATGCLSILFFDPYQFAGRASLALMEHTALTSRHWNPTSKWSVEGCYLYLVLRKLTLRANGCRVSR